MIESLSDKEVGLWQVETYQKQKSFLLLGLFHAIRKIRQPGSLTAQLTFKFIITLKLLQYKRLLLSYKVSNGQGPTCMLGVG